MPRLYRERWRHDPWTGRCLHESGDGGDCWLKGLTSIWRCTSCLQGLHDECTNEGAPPGLRCNCPHESNDPVAS